MSEARPWHVQAAQEIFREFIDTGVIDDMTEAQIVTKISLMLHGMMPKEIKSSDHPEANGRKARYGDTEYELSFPGEDGQPVLIKLGENSFNNISQIVFEMCIDSPKSPEDPSDPHDS